MLQQKTYIYGVSAGLFMVLTFSAAMYLYVTIYKAGDVLSARIVAIEENKSKEKMVKDLEASLLKTEAERRAIFEFVLTEDKTSVFLTEIEKVATMQNVKLTTNSLEVVAPIKKVVASSSTPNLPEPPTSLFDTLAISFLIEGKEGDVKEMLRVFETLPYHSKVNAFSLKHEAGGYAKGTLSLNVSLLK